MKRNLAIFIGAIPLIAATFASHAAEPCPMQRAIYSEPSNGYEVRFVPLARGDGTSNLQFRLHFPGHAFVFEGKIVANQGTSRDEGSLYHGCRDRNLFPEPLSDAERLACRWWNGLFYVLGKETATPLPFADDPAPRTLLLTDLGRQIRYSGYVLNPGEEPEDVFTLQGCAP